MYNAVIYKENNKKMRHLSVMKIKMVDFYDSFPYFVRSSIRRRNNLILTSFKTFTLCFAVTELADERAFRVEFVISIPSCTPCAKFSRVH